MCCAALSCFNRVRLFAILWTVALQTTLFMEFARQEYWSGLPCSPPGDLPNPGTEPRSPTLQVDSSFFFFSSTSLLLPTHLPPPLRTHAQSCNPMDCILPGSSVHGLFQARILEWVAIYFSMQVDSLPSEPQRKPKNTRLGRLSLLQQIFPTQESNWGLLHCKWILYQLSHQVSPSIYTSPQFRDLAVIGLHSLIAAFLFNLISYLSHSLFCEERNSLFMKLSFFLFLALLFSPPSQPQGQLCGGVTCAATKRSTLRVSLSMA